MNILDIPQNVLLYILQLCKPKDLVNLCLTCSFLNELIKDPFLWKELCHRDFGVDPQPSEKTSYEKLYKHLLYKYGYMLGLYQSDIGPCGALLEVRYKGDVLEAVEWEPGDDLMDPLKQSVAFSINGSEFPPKCLCIPASPCPHECFIYVDAVTGNMSQKCHNTRGHIQHLLGLEPEGYNEWGMARLKLVYLNSKLESQLHHSPLILPQPTDIPSELRRRDGSFPRQIITPGLFKGTYSAHGIEIILFKYKDEHEIQGYKVTGDDNVPAGKLSVKILLRYPAPAPPQGKNTFADLREVEPIPREAPLDEITEQPFSIPESCHFDSDIQIPNRCIARYHGYGQVAYEGFMRPTYTRTQVIIFNNDLIGVIWMTLSCFSLFSRVNQTFTTSVQKNRLSVF